MYCICSSSLSGIMCPTPNTKTTRKRTSSLSVSLPTASIDLGGGNLTAFKSYWRSVGDEYCTVRISGSDFMTYESNINKSEVCWFMLPELKESITRLHAVVGNATTSASASASDHHHHHRQKKHIVVGNGSTQIFHAALYALSTQSQLPHTHPINVVSAVPCYSGYPSGTDYLSSRLYKWAGDANEFDGSNGSDLIEVVTSPNNPDGYMRQSVVKVKVNKGIENKNGKLIHDLAYYRPQYTPITHPANHDVMTFTFTKCTGHAGSRIGWAIVKDREVAEKMTEYIMINTVGVSKESQVRAAKIMEFICNNPSGFKYSFFHNSKLLMGKRWKNLRDVIGLLNADFILPSYQNQYCNFLRHQSQPSPAFAWLKCRDEIEDCSSFLKSEYKIESRSGTEFGADEKFARITMACDDDIFNQLLERLSTPH